MFRREVEIGTPKMRLGRSCSYSTLAIGCAALAQYATLLHPASYGQTACTETRQVVCAFAGGARATAASVVSRRNVSVSCRYRRTAVSVWLR
jgi:hypothetical protein